MYASPHPTELRSPLDRDRIIEDDRNLICDHYICCFDAAIDQEWVSWTCADCLLYAELKTIESGAPPS